MFSYICLGTNDPKRSRVFYDTVLATLGQTRCTTPGEEFGDWSGWGQYAQEGVVQLALWLCPPFDGAPAQPGNGVMVALRAWRVGSPESPWLQATRRCIGHQPVRVLPVDPDKLVATGVAHSGLRRGFARPKTLRSCIRQDPQSQGARTSGGSARLWQHPPCRPPLVAYKAEKHFKSSIGA